MTKFYIETSKGNIEQLEAKDLPVDKYKILVNFKHKDWYGYGYLDNDSIVLVGTYLDIKESPIINIESIRDPESGEMTHRPEIMWRAIDPSVGGFDYLKNYERLEDVDYEKVIVWTLWDSKE